MWRLRVVLFVVVAFAAVFCGPCESSEVGVLSGVKSEVAIGLHSSELVLEDKNLTKYIADVMREETRVNFFQNLDFMRELKNPPNLKGDTLRAAVELLNTALLYDNLQVMTRLDFLSVYLNSIRKQNEGTNKKKKFFQKKTPPLTIRNSFYEFLKEVAFGEHVFMNGYAGNREPYTTLNVLEKVSNGTQLRDSQVESRIKVLEESLEKFNKTNPVIDDHRVLVIARYITPPRDIFDEIFKKYEENKIMDAKILKKLKKYNTLFYAALCNQKADFIFKYKQYAGSLLDKFQFQAPKRKYKTIEEYEQNSHANQMRKWLGLLE